MTSTFRPAGIAFEAMTGSSDLIFFSRHDMCQLLQSQQKQAIHKMKLMASVHYDVCALRNALSSWRACVVEAAPRRSLFRAFSHRLQKLAQLWVLDQAWQAWQGYHHALAAEQVSMDLAIVHRNLALCNRSLFGWRAWLRERMQNRRMLQVALQHLAEGLGRQAMCAWKQFIHRKACRR
jgi:hypothetical protein